jgi:hypothetical protein
MKSSSANHRPRARSHLLPPWRPEELVATRVVGMNAGLRGEGGDELLPDCCRRL